MTKVIRVGSYHELNYEELVIENMELNKKIDKLIDVLLLQSGLKEPLENNNPFGQSKNEVSIFTSLEVV